MQRDEFDRILQMGLGRALLFLQEHEAEPYKDLILAHCLRNATYDPQSEGSKTGYLFEIIQLTQDQAFYRDAILAAMQALPAPPEGDFDELDWDASQSFEFGVLFAQQGDEAFRQATYDLFMRRATSHCEFGADDLIELDGLAGFLFVAKHLYSLADPFTPTLNGWCIDIVEERFGAEDIRQYTEREVDNPGLKAYIAYPRERQPARSRRHKVSATPYDEAKQWITQWQVEPIREVGDVDPRLSRFARWGRDVSEEMLVEVAHDMLAAEEAFLLPYLTIFRFRRVPLNFERLFTLAESASSDIALAAIDALAHVEHPTVHVLALRLLQSSTENYPALNLLAKNYREGDHVLIESALAQQSDKDHLQGAGISTVHLNNGKHCSVCGSTHGTDCHALDPLPEGFRDCCSKNVQTAIDIGIETPASTATKQAAFDAFAQVALMVANGLKIKKATLTGVAFFL